MSPTLASAKDNKRWIQKKKKPFLATYNPDIDWKAGTFNGEVTTFSKNTQEWMQENEEFIPELEDNTETNDDYKFIPSNECNVISVYKTTTATELAAQATDKTTRT